MLYVEGASISSDKNSDLFWTDAQSGSPYSQRSNSSHHQQVVGRSSSRPTSTSSVRSSTSSTSSDMQSSTPLWGSHSYGKAANTYLCPVTYILCSSSISNASFIMVRITHIIHYSVLCFPLTHGLCQLHGI